MKFYLFVWSFFGGVFLISVFSLVSSAIILGVIFSGVIVVGALRKEYLLISFLFFLALIMGACRMEVDKHRTPNQILVDSLNKFVTIRGILVDEPDQRENSTNLVVLPNVVSEKILPGSTSEKILVRAMADSNFQYGDEVELKGRLELPQKILSGNADFNYPEYLAKDDIYYLIPRADVRKISTGHGNITKRTLFKLKANFLRNINAILPQPHAGFVEGIVIAGKKSLPKNLLTEFQRTGTLQIIVLSGYNITIVAEAMMRLFSYLMGAGFSYFAGAFSIILFSIMAGGSATVIRATLMALISILAKATHRVYQAKRALFLAGFLMVFQNPRILVYDPSFQLSFLATLGLMVLSPYFEKHLQFLPEKFQIRNTASATLSAQVFVTPLILYQIGQLSLVSVPANMLMMLAIPILMLSGFLTGLWAFVSKIVAFPLAFISYTLVSYELLVLKIFSRTPFASITLPFSVWLLAISYGLYIFMWIKSYKGRSA